MEICSYFKTALILVLALNLLDGINAKKKAKKGKNPPKKSEKVPEKPKLRLVQWFGNMSDITYRCPATTYPNYKRVAPISNHSVITVSDCSVEGSRWDYDIKVS